MSSLKKRAMFVAVLLVTVLACATTTPTVTPVPSDLNALHTAVVETIVALTKSAVPETLLASETATSTATFTFTPQPPTLTATQTATAIPIFTSTLPIPLISVSVATNCRNGPGKVYGYEGALLIGQFAEILARDPTNNYWYIRNPDSSGSSFCWVWGEYATIYGNVAILPIYTPPPTPTPTRTPLPTLTSTPAPVFNISYTSLDTCTGWWTEFKIKNTGSIEFRSVEIKVQDVDTAVVLSNLTDGFTDLTDCLTSTKKDVLTPGNSLIVSAPAFMYDPTGHTIRATVTMCSNTGQSGLCVTKKIEFKP